MQIRGTFTVTMKPEAPHDDVEGVALARVVVEKVFSGSLVGTSKVEMLAARGPDTSSAGYVALERIRGTVDGREGTFVAAHLGLADDGQRSLRIHVVPGSGTGGLRGIAGTMEIEIVEGRHEYRADLTFR